MENKCCIYIHIPFCLSKCFYCNFLSKCNASNQEINKYIDYLILEISNFSKYFKDKTINSIYIGGGTPNLIDSKLILKVLNTIYDLYNLEENAEITIEGNPCFVNKQKLLDYKQIGINRLSFGVQSLNSKVLKVLGRRHNSKQAISCVKLAKTLGFKNISCDLLIGATNSKLDLLKDIKKLNKLGVNHISAYMLMVEKDTKLFEKVKNNQIKIASDEKSVDIYNKAYKLLKKLGFERYEISNFAKKGCECKHNCHYWEMQEYIGFGIASHSFVQNYRISEISDFDKYYKYVENVNDFDIKKISQYKNIEKLQKENLIEEYIMLSLRCKKGVNLTKLKSIGYNLLDCKKQNIKNLLKYNMIKIDGENLMITDEYFGASNSIIVELI